MMIAKLQMAMAACNPAYVICLGEMFPNEQFFSSWHSLPASTLSVS